MAYAKIVFQRGFGQVYLLRGGPAELYQKYPDFAEGSDMPPLLKALAEERTRMIS